MKKGELALDIIIFVIMTIILWRLFFLNLTVESVAPEEVSTGTVSVSESADVLIAYRLQPVGEVISEPAQDRLPPSAQRQQLGMDLPPIMPMMQQVF